METYFAIQDKKGYMWIGTDAGLNRFDGYQFKTYTTKDGLANNDVVGLFIDNKDRIWIRSLGHLVYLENDSFHIFNPDGFHFESHLFSFTKLDDSGYLISNYHNIYKLSNDLELSEYDPPFPLLGRFNQLFKDEKKGYWAYNKKRFYHVANEVVLDSFKIKDPAIFDINFHATRYEQNLFYSTKKGLMYFDLVSRKEELLLENFKNIRHLEIYEDKLWIVDAERGLWAINFEAGEIGTAYPILKDIVISFLTRDDEGNFWLPSYGNGLFFLPSSYENIDLIEEADGLYSSKIESVIHSGGKTIVGTASAVINQIRGDNILTFELPNRLGNGVNRIIEMLTLPNGDLLLGTDLGVVVWDFKTFRPITIEPTKNLSFGRNDDVLICTNRGVYSLPLRFVLDKTNTKPVSLHKTPKPAKRISSNRAYAALQDKSGQYWCDDTREGLVTVNNGEAYYWGKELGGPFKSSIVEILELDNGLIALATQGQGVLLVRGEEYVQINSALGLSSDLCNDLISDGKNLWVATNRGVTSIKEIDFEQKSFQLDIYNNLDGLISNEIKSISRSGDTLLLASPKGVIRFKESDLSSHAIPPKIDITNIYINESDTLIQDSYVLGPKQNNIRIHFVGLSYSNQGNLVYKYKLDGVDNDWIQTTSLETHYSQLPPGTYQFNVIAIGQQGMESVDQEQLLFVIKPAFVQTVWFKLLIALGTFILGLTAFYSFYNFRQRTILRRKVEEKTQELNEKLNDLADLNEKLERSNKELAEFAHVASHDLKSPLRNVAGFIQLLKRRSKDRLLESDMEFIDLAVKGVKQMELIINDLLSMSKVNQLDMNKELVDFGDVVHGIIGDMQIEIENKNAKVAIDDELPMIHFSATNAKQLFQNLISNAIKYQDKPIPKIEIGCEQEKGHYKFSVKDNGIGIEADYQDRVFAMFQRLHTQDHFSGTGIGLSICKKIVENNKGQIWFESTPGEGTTFYFTLPTSLAHPN